MPSPTLGQLIRMGYFPGGGSRYTPKPGSYDPRTSWSGRIRNIDQYQALMTPGTDISPGIEYRSSAPSRPLDPGFRAGAGVRGLPESAGQPGGADISPLSWYGSDAEQTILNSVNKEGFEERWDAATAGKEQALLDSKTSKAGTTKSGSGTLATLPKFTRNPPPPESGPGAFARGTGPFYQGNAFSGAHSAGMSFLQQWLNNSFGAGSRGYGGKSPGDPSNAGKGVMTTGGEGWSEGSGRGGAGSEAAFERMLLARYGVGSGGGTGAAGGRGYVGAKGVRAKKF